MSKEEGEWEYKKTNQGEKEEQEAEFEEVVPDMQNIWLPATIGDSIQGTVTEITEGQYGIYAVLHTEDDETIVTAAHKILQSRVEKLKVGDFVKIIYKGMSRTQGGREVTDYRLLKRKSE